MSWFVAIAAIIQAAALVTAVLYARGQLAELRESREQTTRPFVVIDVETRQTIATLKVRNIGQSVARNVTFTFSPELVSTFDGRMGDGGSYVLAEIEMFARGIPSLAPGKAHSTLLDQVPQRLAAGLPKRYEVDVSFDAPNGKHYTDRQTLSLETHIGLTRVDRKGEHEIAKALEDLVRELKRWGASGGGLRVANDAEIRARFARLMETQQLSDRPEDDQTSDDAEGEDSPDERAA